MEKYLAKGYSFRKEKMKRLVFSVPWPLSSGETREVFHFAFQTALVAYLFFYLLEFIKPNFVVIYFRLEIFLWVAIITGMLTTIWPVITSTEKSKVRPLWQSLVWAALIALVVTLAVKEKIQATGGLNTIIATLCGLVVLGICLLIYFEQDAD